MRTTAVGFISHHFGEILNDAKFNIFHHAPVLILISIVAEMPWAVEDGALAAENLMLAARAVGLGTLLDRICARLATPEGKALLKLPTSHKPVAPIIVGHPKSQPVPVPRKEPEIRWVG